ncbi:muellerian-inhibiting factor [Oenanthe melanoleuca]|uniref:muellerian-inhibiting factor n=1 Tax=Oenanthe melanoleuca TaxID=2939378 RepID=UPI0024C15C44|nr:muellerian-inhibiting factor [Oenanthe melanoleuca]
MSALRELLLCLVLLLPSAALPRKQERDSLLEPSLLEELQAEGRKVGNGSLQESPRSRRAAGTRPLPEAEPGGRCPQGEAEEGGPGWSSPQPWPLGALEGPVCRVRMEQDGAGPRHLEVVGVLSHYESSFIKLLRRRRSWDGTLAGTFGLCPARGAGAAPHPLQRIHQHVLEPRPRRFLVLHLEEVQWEAQVKLRFQLVFQAEVGRALGELQAAVMLFYLGRREGSGPPQELLLTGPGLARDQRLCLSRDTQFLALAAAAASVTRSAERLRFSASLAIHGGAGGAPLPRAEVQQLLFGSDDKCFTRMTPVLLLLAKPRQQEEEEEEEEALAPSSYLSAEGVVDTAPYPQLSPAQAGSEELPTPTAPSQANTSSPAPGGSAQFLAVLTQFIRQLLNSSSEPPPQPNAHHWLDFEVMETLPHQLLNLSEEAALERLVQSEEPSVLLLPQDSGAVLEQHLGDWQPEGSVLQLLTGKLQLLIQELRDIPAFQANAALFQHLLSFCYFPAEPGQAGPAERGRDPRKLRTLLLLKALQAVRARWQEHRKVQRQNRSARHQAHCRLQELTIDLRDRHFIVMPTAYVANNCEGPCRLPLSSRISSYFSHTVLLLDVQERGSPLRRAPCCVPVRYSDQLIISLSSDGLEIRKFPNMVAEECGCR